MSQLPSAARGRGDLGARRARTAAILSVATEVPRGAADQRRARRAARHQRGVDLSRTGIRERPTARPRRAADRLRGAGGRGGPGAGRGRRRRPRPGDRGHDDPGRADPEHRAAGGACAGRRPRRGVRRRRRVHGVPVGPGAWRRRRSRAAAPSTCCWSAPTSSPGSPTTRTGKTAPLFARRGGRRGARARPTVTTARSARSCSAPTARTAQTIMAGHDERKLRMDGPEVFRHAVKRMSEVDARGRRASRADARGHRPVRLPPGERADHARARRTARGARRARRRLHRDARQLIRGDAARWRWRSRTATGGCGRARGCCWARSAPASPGAAGVIEWGDDAD